MDDDWKFAVRDLRDEIREEMRETRSEVRSTVTRGNHPLRGLGMSEGGLLDSAFVKAFALPLAFTAVGAAAAWLISGDRGGWRGSANPVVKEVLVSETYSVFKPVVDTVMKEEEYVVERPVLRREMEDQQYTVRRPVRQVVMRPQTVTVERPVTETVAVSQQVVTPTLRPVLVNRFGFLTTEWQYVNTASTQIVPTQTTRLVSSQETRMVPVEEVRYVEEQRVRRVPVDKIDYVKQLRKRRVPTFETRIEEEQKTRTVKKPVVVYRDVNEYRLAPATAKQETSSRTTFKDDEKPAL